MSEEISIVIRAKNEAERALAGLKDQLKHAEGAARNAAGGAVGLKDQLKHTEGAARNAAGSAAGLKDQLKHTEGAARSAAGGFAGLGASMKAAETGSTAIGVALGVAAAGLLGIGGASIKMAADMEQSRIAFTTLLKDAGAADIFLKQLFDFAAKTPFEFTQVQEAAKRMMAFGFAARDLIPMLTTVGDAVSALGGGAEMINRVTLALGQMNAKGKVSAQEMNQLAESGLPAWQLLAEKIGKSIPEAMALAEKGAISSAVAIPAILEGMNKRFAGGMAAQSKSALGILSNLKDNIGGLMRGLGDELIKNLNIKEALKVVTDAVTDLNTSLQRNGLEQTLQRIFSPELRMALFATAGALTAALIPALYATAAAFVAAMVPIAPLILAGGAVTALLYGLATDFHGMRTAAIQAMSLMAAGVVMAFSAMVTAVPRMVLGMVETVLDGFARLARGTAAVLAKLPGFGQAAADGLRHAAGIAEAAVNAAGAASDRLGQIGEDAAAAIIQAGQAAIAAADDWGKTKPLIDAVDPSMKRAAASAGEAAIALAGGSGGGDGGLAGAAKKTGAAVKEAKTALEEFGGSLDMVRKAGDLLKWSQGQLDAVILAVGGTALDVGPMVEGFNQTFVRMVALFNAAGLDGKEVVNQLHAIGMATKAAEEAEKAATKAKQAAEEATRDYEKAINDLKAAQEAQTAEAQRAQDRMAGLASTIMGTVKPAFEALFATIKGGAGAGLASSLAAALTAGVTAGSSSAAAADAFAIPGVTEPHRRRIMSVPSAAGIAAAQETAKAAQDAADAAKAANDAVGQQDAALRQRLAAGWKLIGGIIGDVTGSILKITAGVRGPETASAAVSGLNAATGIAAALVTAKADASDAFGAINNALDQLGRNLGNLDEPTRKATESLIDGARRLLAEFRAGNISAKQYADAMAVIGGPLQDVARDADAAAAKVKALAEAHAGAVATVLEKQAAAGAVNMEAALAAVARGEWVESLKKALRDAILAGADTKPITDALAAVAADDRLRAAAAAAGKAISDSLFASLADTGTVTLESLNDAIDRATKGQWAGSLKAGIQQTIQDGIAAGWSPEKILEAVGPGLAALKEATAKTLAELNAAAVAGMARDTAARAAEIASGAVANFRVELERTGATAYSYGQTMAQATREWEAQAAAAQRVAQNTMAVAATAAASAAMRGRWSGGGSNGAGPTAADLALATASGLDAGVLVNAFNIQMAQAAAHGSVGRGFRELLDQLLAERASGPENAGPSFDLGGDVGAPRGRPLRATVHGDETVLTPAMRRDLMGMLAGRGAGGGATNVNVTLVVDGRVMGRASTGGALRDGIDLARSGAVSGA